MTFEEIAKANETIRTTNIKGKEYAEVNQRIKAFRMVYPAGSIQTEIISLDDKVCTMKATIFDDSGNAIGTGHAQELKESSYINKTSYIENCETSCVGRALGMCGFGIDTSVASAEEVRTAINNQNPVVCEGCGKTIVPITKRDGTVWEVDDIVNYSKRRFKQTLCPDCQRAALKEAVKNE